MAEGLPAFDDMPDESPATPKAAPQPSAALPSFDAMPDEGSEWGGYASTAGREFGKGVVTGAGSLVAGVPEPYRVADPTIDKNDPWRGGGESGTGQLIFPTQDNQPGPFQRAGKTAKDWATRHIPTTPTEDQSITGQVFSGTGSMVAPIGVGMATGPLGAAIAFGLQGKAEQEEAAREHGATPENVRKAGEVGFLLNAAGGVIPFHQVLKPIERTAPGLANWAATRLKKAAQDGAVFAGAGEAMHWLGQEIAKEFYDPTAGYSFDIRRVISSLLSGGVLSQLHRAPYRPGEGAGAGAAGETGEQPPAVAQPPGAPPGAEAGPSAAEVEDELTRRLGPSAPQAAPESESILPEAPAAWTPQLETTPGLKAFGQDQADALKRVWAETSPIKTVDDLFVGAKENQKALGDLGRSISDEIGDGVTFRDPGVKGRPRTQEKVDEGKSPGRINDVVRAGFLVERPEHAEQVVQRIAAKYPIIDEGWAVTPEGYFDRKVLVRFPNGQAGEIQLWHPDLYDAKDKRGGAKLYTEARSLSEGDPRKAELERQQRELYGAALASADPEWRSVVEGGSTPGNLARNAASDSRLASMPTTEELAGRQVPLANTRALPGTQTIGSPSQLPNVQFSSAINKNIGPDGTISKAVPGIAPHRVAAADGTAIDVAPIVVEAGDLRTSQDQGYDTRLQPRQRGDRLAAQQQVRGIANQLEPERLGHSAEADRGAPIVGPDGMVESGNGRVEAIRQVYASVPERAKAYRDWLSRQGVDVSKFREPVLVRLRTTDLTTEGRRDFTVAANQAATLAMSAPERAMADARHLDPAMLGLIHSPDDLAAPANRPFFRRFVAGLPQSEHGSFADAKGALSAEGLMRARNAILAKAYGDAATLSRIAESTNDEVKSISNALVAAAPQWAKFRAEVEAGHVRPDMDVTADLIAAVNRTADIRGRGDKLDEHLSQQDAFDRISGPIEGFMRAFYDPSGRKAAGSERIAKALRFYAEDAGKVSAAPGLDLKLTPVEPEAVLRLAREKEWEDVEHGEEFPNGRGPGDGQGVPPPGELGGRSRAGAGGELPSQRGPGGFKEASIRAQQPTAEELRGLGDDPYKPVRTFPGEEGVEARVYKNSDGRRFNVTLYDRDSGQTLSTAFIVPTIEAAEKKARSLVERPPVETVPLAAGKTGDQYVIPGAERISTAELLRRRAAEPLRPTLNQEIPGGLFGDLLGQEELFHGRNANHVGQQPLRPSAVELAQALARGETAPAVGGEQERLAQLAPPQAGEAGTAAGDLTPRPTVPNSATDLFGETPSATASATATGVRPPRGGLRPAAPGVPGEAQPKRPIRAKRPGQLSLFGGEPSGGELPGANAPVSEQPGGAEAGSPQPSESVTKPPASGGGTDPARPHPAAGAGGPRAGIKEAEQKIAERSRSNYRITPDDRIGEGGPKEKARANIDAVRILKRLEDEGREATAGEKAVLVKYTGWGAFSQAMFDPHKPRPEWKTERDALRALVTDEEWNAARASTVNAHYTTPDVIRGMWSALDHLGFEGGTAIEPAAGIGHFIGLIPDTVAPRTAWTGVELDSLTGRIAKALYGGVEMNVHGFEDLKRPSNYYDLAISNVPFNEVPVKEKPYGSFPLHDFFFVKALDKIRPGGVVAFITSKGTMDKANAATRRLLSKDADLVGAIRLPGGDKGAFAKNAGTEVTTDIVFLRKKIPGEKPFPGAKWEDTKVIETPEGPTKINEYFAANPKMMLGEMRLLGTQYRDAEPVLIGDSEGLAEKIRDAAQGAMPAGALTPRMTPKPETVAAIDIGTGVKDGNFFLKDGKLYQRIAGEGVAHDVTPEQHDRAVRFMGMRDLYNDLLDSQMSGDGERSEASREKLRKAYDAFVAKYGPINKEVRTVTQRLDKKGEPVVIVRRPNLDVIDKDPDVWKVASIEQYDAESNEAKRASIQTKDVIRPPTTREINGPSDALAAALNDTGRVDLDHVAQSLGVDDIDQAAGALGDLIYQDPNGRQWRTADEYLSGNVVQKLEEARTIAARDPSYLRNVAALEKAQPTPLLPGPDITASFGAPWVPGDVYADFAKEVMGARNPKITQVPITGDWKASALSYPTDAYSRFGVEHYVDPGEVLQAALNNKQIKVYGERDANGDRPVLPKQTEEANNKVAALREAFAGDPEQGIDGWVWQDQERGERLAGIFNRLHNNIANRTFDGSHLTLPGINPKFADRSHRKDAVWRIIQNGNTLLGHAVGSGKTVTMVAAGMEMKRLGLINKPMFPIPNHMLEQFSREFLEAYPNAKILVASREETSAANRKAFIAKAASNDWDGIVVTHDAFGRIGMGQEWRRQHVQNQLDELERIYVAEKHENGKSAPTVKALEKLKKKLENKLDDLMNEERKDEGLNFEHTGVDFLFVDEAHKFKNLSFLTRQQNINGLSKTASQRAEDLFLKIRYLEQNRPGRSAVLATGTPVSNTLAEVWTMMRYLQFDKLREQGLDGFDNWAGTFAKIVTKPELSIDGRTLKDVTSFSKFTNTNALGALYSEIADTKTADMLNLPKPEVKTRSGAPGIEIVEAEPSAQEEGFIQALVALAEEIKGKRSEPGSPNIASIGTAGRKVALDGRLVGNTMTDRAIMAKLGDWLPEFNPRGKVAKAVDNITRIYQEGNKDPSAPDKVQMVWADMGAPSAKGTDAEGKIDIYNDLKKRLVEKGIPAKEIAFIHDADNDIKKAKLFKAVRDGKVRVIVGSSEKMGVGTNVQDRLIAMHHLDAPWRPADVEQRDGRIARQGNLNPSVQIYRYVTKKSFDAFIWQKLDRKAKFINQFLSGAKGSNVVDDIDNPLPEAAEMKAAASGDPRILEHAELDRQIRALTSQRRTFEQTQQRADYEIGAVKSRIKQIDDALPNARDDSAMVNDLSGDKFQVDLGDKGILNERKAAGQAILDGLRALDPRGYYRPAVVKIGRLSGFDMNIEVRTGMAYDGTGTFLEATPSLKGRSGYGAVNPVAINEHTDPVGLMLRFERVLHNIRQEPERIESLRQTSQQDLARLEKTLGDKWPKEKEYRAALAKMHDLTESMKAPRHPDVVEAQAADEAKAQRQRMPTAAERVGGPQPGERAVKIGKDAFAYLAPKYTEAEKKIAAAVQDIAKRMAPQATVMGAKALRLRNDRVWGAFVNSEQFPNLIAWSLERGEPAKIAQTVRHEIVHHLKDAGLIQPDEWKALSDAAKDRDWLGKYDIEGRYADMPEDHKIEEAIAEHFGHWRTERSIEKPGLIRDAFNRLDLLLKRVAAAARQFLGKDATPDDVLTRIETGEIGRRAPGYAQEPEVRGQTPERENREARQAAVAAAGGPQSVWGHVVNAGDKLREATNKATEWLTLDPVVLAFQRRTVPMAMRTSTPEARAIVKDYMNNLRQAQHRWLDAAKYLTDKFNPAQLEKMWNAADEQSVALQQGRPTQGIGLDRLTPGERQATEFMQRIAEGLFRRAKDLGMVEGEGLPSYAPRMLVRMAESGKYEQGIGGPDAKIVRDIRTLAQANMKLERAIAGRELINKIKEVGDRSGSPTVWVGGKPALRNRQGADGLIAHAIDVSMGKNFATTSPNLKHRKYLTADETEAAARRAPMPDNAAPKVFTLSHPAFHVFRPDMVDPEGDTFRGEVKRVSGMTVPKHSEVRRDQHGDVVWKQVPIYVREEFEGPLRAALEQDWGQEAQRMMMTLKSKVMSVVMFSPLIHNQVEWGRAIPAAPGKVLTFQVYTEGNAVKNDPAQMREAINSGLVPIGGHGFMQDITDMAAGEDLEPGQRSLTTQGIGYGAKMLGNLTKIYDPEAGSKEVKRALDKAGNFWHNTLLWDRVGDLQMGLWKLVRDDMVHKGHDPQTANIVAAHFANRYAGALPLESMSGAARAIANLLLFSRSFTLGNVATYKDAVLGLPRDVQGLILQRLGPEQLAKAQSFTKRKSRAMLAIDAGLYYTTLSVLQSAFHVVGAGASMATLGGTVLGGALGGRLGPYGRLAGAAVGGAAGYGASQLLGLQGGTRTLQEEVDGYWDRFQKLLTRSREHPFQAMFNPLSAATGLLATAENEPGLEGRLMWGYDKDGRAQYMRLPAGKVTEELLDWFGATNDILHRKLSTFARPLNAIWSNDVGFGHKLYDPNADTPTEKAHNIMRIAAAIAWAQTPVDLLKSVKDLITGPDRGEAASKLVSQATGFTFRQGHPEGPAAGYARHIKDKHDFAVQEAMPSIHEKLRKGQLDLAQKQMESVNMPEGLQNWYLNRAGTVGPMSRKQVKEFMGFATDEQAEEFSRREEREEEDRRRIAARQQNSREAIDGHADGGAVDTVVGGGEPTPKEGQRNPPPIDVRGEQDRLAAETLGTAGELTGVNDIIRAARGQLNEQEMNRVILSSAATALGGVGRVAGTVGMVARAASMAGKGAAGVNKSLEKRAAGGGVNGKVTKASVNYRDGAPAEHCGNCSMYEAHKCSLVAGVIAPQKVCSKWDPQQRADGGSVDYDMDAARAAGVQPDANGHLPDTYKLPNHMTFSDESVYHNPENQGGHWDRIQGDEWNFTPGPANLKHHSIEELQDYFSRHEPKSHLITPKRAHGGRVDRRNIDHAPTEKQKRAGNYAKDHLRFQGLPLTIENAKGSYRGGVGKDGKPWAVCMPCHYGYVKRTEGADGDHVDIFLGPHKKAPNVYVVDQHNAETGKWDEHKAMLGFGSATQALAFYCKSFSDGKGKKRCGHITTMTLARFKDWVKDGDTTQPLKAAA